MRLTLARAAYEGQAWYVEHLLDELDRLHTEYSGYQDATWQLLELLATDTTAPAWTAATRRRALAWYAQPPRFWGNSTLAQAAKLNAHIQQLPR